MPQPLVISACIRRCTTRAARSGWAIPDHRQWPGFDVRTRHRRFSPSSASARRYSPIARRTFGKDVPALDLGNISLLVINDNEFVRTYMERLFSIMRVGSVVTCANPRSARHGLAWYEFDVNWVQIKALEKLGLARKVYAYKLEKETKHENIQAETLQEAA